MPTYGITGWSVHNAGCTAMERIVAQFSHARGVAAMRSATTNDGGVCTPHAGVVKLELLSSKGGMQLADAKERRAPARTVRRPERTAAHP